MIIKECPLFSQRVTSLLPVAYIPEITIPLSYCIQLAIGTWRAAGAPIMSQEAVLSDIAAEAKINPPNPPDIISDKVDPLLPPQPQLRPELDVSADTAISSEEYESTQRKRRKLNTGTCHKTGLSVVYTDSTSLPAEASEAVEMEEVPHTLPGGNSNLIDVLLSKLALEEENLCSAASVYKELLQMMDGLEPPADVMQSETPSVEGLLAALQVLVRVFTKHPVGVCNQRLIQLVHNWMPWILGKVCVLIC